MYRKTDKRAKQRGSTRQCTNIELIEYDLTNYLTDLYKGYNTNNTWYNKIKDL